MSGRSEPSNNDPGLISGSVYVAFLGCSESHLGTYSSDPGTQPRPVPRLRLSKLANSLT